MLGEVLMASPGCNETMAEEKNPIERSIAACPIVREAATTDFLKLANGVTDCELIVQLRNGRLVKMYILSVDCAKSDVSFKVALPDNKAPELQLKDGIPSGWSKATLSSMAGALEKDGESVIAMVNGDFWNTTSTIPKGPVHFRSTVVSDYWDNTEDKPQQGLSYVGVRQDGSVELGTKAEYTLKASDYSELTGAGIILVKDGKAQDAGNTTIYPRCSVGTAEDKVHFLLVDGPKDKKHGLKYEEMSEIFISLGCTEAVNLDGGGSAQLLVRNPEGGRLEIRNNPADGKERAVINGWALTL